MNNEQQELLNEAYENFIHKTKGLNLNLEINRDIIVVEGPVYNATPRLLIKEEFINKCKTDPDFSERWGLKIEERELSLEERYDLIEKDKHTQFVKWQDLGTDRIKEVLDEKNVPTKLITVTRELSEEEIWDYIHKNKIEILHQHAVLYSHAVGSEYRKSFIPTLIVHYNIPTKETIESYE